MSVPTHGEVFARLIHHIRKAQDDAAILAHLENTESRRGVKAKLWLMVSEQFKRMVETCTSIATKGLN